MSSHKIYYDELLVQSKQEKKPMSMSLFRDLMNTVHDRTDPEEVQLDNEDIVFLLNVDSDLGNFTDVQISGLISHKKKASLRGCGSVYPTNIQEIPIVHEESFPRIIMRKDRPDNVRQNVPLYEDVRYCSTLFGREVFLEDLQAAHDAADFHAIPFQSLTTDIYPCDYYYDNFMRGPSQYNVDPIEASAKKAIRLLGEERKTTTLTTIWAENSKALVRYAKAGFNRIHVLYPSDFTKSHHAKIAKYALDACPGVEIFVVDVCSSKELLTMSSADLISRYKLDVNSTFMCHYLPQFLHLRYGFVDFSCMYLDESVKESSVEMEIPVFKVTMATILNYYNCWFAENMRKGVLSGHCGVYDPIRRIRLSFSQHGAFVDHIRNPSDFGASDFVINDVASFTGILSKTKLNICRKFFVEKEIKSDDISKDSFTLVKTKSVDISWLDLPAGVLYFPSVDYFVVKTNNMGELLYNGVSYAGFPVDRDCYVVRDFPVLMVLDLAYVRKDFFARRRLIPPEYCVPFSRVQYWDLAYAVFPFSAGSVIQFSVDYDLRFELLSSNKELRRYSEWIIPGVAINKELNQFVWDSEMYTWIGPISFDFGDNPRKRYYEFKEQVAVRKALRFSNELGSCEIPHSLSTAVITAVNMESLLMDILPPNIRDMCMVNMSPYYVGVAESGYADIQQDLIEEEFGVDRLYSTYQYDIVTQEFFFRNRNLLYCFPYESDFLEVHGGNIVLKIDGGYWVSCDDFSSYVPALYLKK